jgi:hypothetical protein
MKKGPKMQVPARLVFIRQRARECPSLSAAAISLEEQLLFLMMENYWLGTRSALFGSREACQIKRNKNNARGQTVVIKVHECNCLGTDWNYVRLGRLGRRGGL